MQHSYDVFTRQQTTLNKRVGQNLRREEDTMRKMHVTYYAPAPPLIATGWLTRLPYHHPQLLHQHWRPRNISQIDVRVGPTGRGIGAQLW